MVSKLFNMKRGTKIGWVMVAFAILLSLWVIIGQSAKADTTTPEGLVIDDSGTIVRGYVGTEGVIPASVFPSTVTTIEAKAFKDTNISSVELPASVTSIGEEAFSGCGNLANIAFSTTGVTAISRNTFANCNSLSSVSLPAGITSIEENAFLNCGSLQSCKLPGGATVDPLAFKGCSSLAKYEIDGGLGTNYMSYNGNLYDTTGQRLLRVAPGISSLTEGEIYSGCIEIGTGAFSANQWLTEFTVPAKVSKISQNAFSGSSIVKLTVSSALTNIEDQGSWGSLKEVYGYSDSPAETFAINHTDEGVMFYAIDLNNAEEEVVDDTGEDAQPTPAPSGNTGTIINNTVTGNTVTNGGGSTAVTASGKDVTPKTADGDFDIRWFAIMGIFLAGIASIIYSRFRKLEYISVKKESDLDS